MMMMILAPMGGVPVRMEMVDAMELLKSVHLIIVEWVRALCPPKNQNIREFSQNWCFIFYFFISCNFNFDSFGYFFIDAF